MTPLRRSVLRYLAADAAWRTRRLLSRILPGILNGHTKRTRREKGHYGEQSGGRDARVTLHSTVYCPDCRACRSAAVISRAGYSSKRSRLEILSVNTKPKMRA